MQVISQESTLSLTGNTLTTVIRLRCSRKLSLNTILDRLNINDECSYSLFAACTKDPAGPGYLATLHRYGEKLN